ITLLFLNSIAKYQIPTFPGQTLNTTIRGLLPGGFTPVPSERLDENQKENNQYGHLVWRRDINTRNFFSLAGYFRHTRATFRTDPLNVLAYVPDVEEPFSAGSQDRTGYSGGVRMDYTYVYSKEHLIKAGFQIDRTQAINKTRLSTFNLLDPLDPESAPIAPVINTGGDNRLIGWRQEFWLQDQWTPNEHWTVNIGVRADTVQYQRDEGQISPRVGVTYRYNSANAFHAFYGRMFTPPNLERLALAGLNTEGTKAHPEDTTNNLPRAERAHYFQIGSVHALTDWATLQLTGYYKLANYLSDAHQLGTTPLLNYFAFERGWTRGADAALKVWFMENLTGRASIAWGQCKGYGLQSGHNLVHFEVIADINSRSG
ncbi:MAG: TonB-dependent receptor, partial [Nitrospira sp.]